MAARGHGQTSGAEFKNRWYTDVGWGLQPHFHDLKSRSGDGNQRATLKHEAGETLVNKKVLC